MTYLCFCAGVAQLNGRNVLACVTPVRGTSAGAAVLNVYPLPHQVCAHTALHTSRLPHCALLDSQPRSAVMLLGPPVVLLGDVMRLWLGDRLWCATW